MGWYGRDVIGHSRDAQARSVARELAKRPRVRVMINEPITDDRWWAVVCETQALAAGYLGASVIAEIPPDRADGVRAVVYCREG